MKTGLTYKSIIEKNVFLFGERARFAFHYTNITNAINILKEECLYSRCDIMCKGLMLNDNASRQVINTTKIDVLSNVRFYFRPLTPTQYYNEGYKHPLLRYQNDDNANVPVPIFFLFDLEGLLSLRQVQFSEKSLAGNDRALFKEVEDFSKLNFNQIYKNGSMENVQEEKKYRQAEIVFKGKFPIDTLLRGILCRNETERLTLLNLLRRTGSGIYNKYKSYIKIDNSCYENNGLFIANCYYHKNTVTIEFSDTESKKYYITRYWNKCFGDQNLNINVEVMFYWEYKESIVSRQTYQFSVDYRNALPVTFTDLKKPDNATALYMEVMFDKNLMAYMCWQLSDLAILK